MDYKEIAAALKKKVYHPIYLLMGDEPYFIDKITGYMINNVLTEEERTFNQVIMYGKEADINNVIDAARRYPMMSSYQMVVLKEAQDLKEIDKLIHYVEQPLKSTILVINYKYRNLDRRTKLYKAIQKNGVIFESKKLYDNQVPAWISQYLKQHKLTIEPAAAALLAEYLGTSLSKIVNEVEKLIITLGPQEKNITATHIEKNIGISKDFNNFELTKALAGKNALKSYRIIDHFAKNPQANPLVLTIATLYMFFSKTLAYHFAKDKSPDSIASLLKIHKFFVNDYKMAASKYSANGIARIISKLREYDLRSKGIGNTSVSEGELLRELIFIILHTS